MGGWVEGGRWASDWGAVCGDAGDRGGTEGLEWRAVLGGGAGGGGCACGAVWVELVTLRESPLVPALGKVLGMPRRVDGDRPGIGVCGRGVRGGGRR